MAGSLNDTVAIRILRVTLDEIFIDRRFFARNAMSASEVAEYILAQLSRGERDPDRLKALALQKLSDVLPT
jgi:hypothetical protein